MDKNIEGLLLSISNNNVNLAKKYAISYLEGNEKKCDRFIKKRVSTSFRL